MTRKTQHLLTMVFAAWFTACALGSDKALERQRARAGEIPLAHNVRLHADDVLESFGKMVVAYNTALGQDPPIIEVDYLGNLTGNSKFPTDFGPVVRHVLSRIGQIITTRSLPAALDSPKPFIGPLSQLETERPKPPQSTFRIEGQIVGAQDVVTKTRNGRGDATAGGGHTATDGSLTGDRSLTITQLTIILNLEYPNGENVPWTSSRSRIDVNETGKNIGISLFVGGTGFAIGSGLKFAQDNSDALYSAVAFTLIQTIGIGMHMPYFRCIPAFPSDSRLEEMVRSGFARQTQSELEHRVKRFLIVAGFAMDTNTADLTIADRAIVSLEMQRRNLKFNSDSPEGNHTALVEFLMQLWRGLDFESGAKRVETLLVSKEWIIREQQEQQAREQNALAASPTEFGWPANAPIIVLDLSRVHDLYMQNQIVDALRMCSKCGPISRHPVKPYIAIRTTLKAEVQDAVSSRPNLHLQCVWLTSNTPHLLVVPLTTR